MIRRSCWLFLTISLFTARAQENTATLSGQVLDSSGAGIPGARVVARNVQTGIERTAVANDTANYTIPQLGIGAYDISAEKEGFKKSIQTGVVLEIDQHARIDFKLQVGAVSESVEVTAEVPLTQTDTSSVGSVIDNQKVVEMPLNGRQFYSLALLVPGVAPPAQGSILSFRGGFNVAGASELNNNFTLNGLENNDQLLSAPAFRPSVDAIQEFKILTGVFPAEYGRNSGSQVIVTTKAGGNAFHGSAFEFLRNQVTDAKNFFTPANAPIPGFKQNQFGGTVGGPIIHNKTFFFASYEGTRSTQQITAVTNVPTPEMLNGDFRQLLTLAKPIRVLNPFTGKDFSTPNVLDASLINPIGKALGSFYPTPTSPTAAGQVPTNNYVFNQPQGDQLDLGSLRIDHTFSTQDAINGSYNDFEENTLSQNNVVCGSRVIPGFDCTVLLLSRLAGIAETHIFNPNLVNEVKVGVSEFMNPRMTNDQDIKFIQQFNIPGTRFDGPPYAGVPSVSVQGYAGFGEPTNFPQMRVDRTYQLADTISWVHGKHAFKFGLNLMRFQTNGTVVGNGRGSYTFSAQTATTLSSGYSVADLLLALPTSTARSPLSPRYYDRTGLYAGFVQDDWKVTPRLTLNVGVRYEYNIPIYDHRNLLSNFNPTTGQIDVAGMNGVPAAVWNPNYRDIEPRFGFSWQPFSTSKTVLRAGYGIFYNAPALNNLNSGPQQSNAPFVSAQTFNASIANPISLSNPYPSTNAGAGTLTLSAIERHLPDAQIQQWSFNIQQELTKSMVLEVGYQGSKGTYLPLLYNINEPPPGLGTVAQKQALRPYPQFGNISFLTADGNSSFNGLLLRLEQRYHGGLSFLLAYLHGKSIDDTPGTPYNVTPSRSSAEDRTNFRLERGLSGFDIRDRLVISPVYELPFGKGKPYANGNRVLSSIVGGWEISGILTLQSGHPFTALVSRDNANVLGNVDRPNVLGDPYKPGPVSANPSCAAPAQLQTPSAWINPCAFALAPAGTFGNEGRNNIIGPSFKNLDVVVSRVFRIRERVSMQLRFEAFNAFNHPNFDLPAQTFDNSTFGSIPAAEAARQLQFGLKIRF